MSGALPAPVPNSPIAGPSSTHYGDNESYDSIITSHQARIEDLEAALSAHLTKTATRETELRSCRKEVQDVKGAHNELVDQWNKLIDNHESINRDLQLLAKKVKALEAQNEEEDEEDEEGEKEEAAEHDDVDDEDA